MDHGDDSDLAMPILLVTMCGIALVGIMFLLAVT